MGNELEAERAEVARLRGVAQRILSEKLQLQDTVGILNLALYEKDIELQKLRDEHKTLQADYRKLTVLGMIIGLTNEDDEHDMGWLFEEGE